jgi:hypothetical protein
VRATANAKLAGATGTLVACTVPPAADTNSLTFSTKNAPGGVVNLGNVTATPIAVGDTISPYVTGVANVVTSANPAILASSVTGLAPTGITINFSEPINTTNIADICPMTSECSIFVATGTPTAHVNVALNPDMPYSFDATGQFMTIYTAAPLPLPVSGTTGSGQFVVQIPKEDIKDLAGNPMTLGANNSNTAAVPYESFVTSASGGVFLTLNLKTSTTTN